MSSTDNTANPLVTPLVSPPLLGTQLRGEMTANGTHRILSGNVGAEKLVVCVTGVGHYNFTWLGFEDRLVKEGYRVLTYDNWGRGYSGLHASGKFGKYVWLLCGCSVICCVVWCCVI